MSLGLESAIEDLGLSVRTRNALRSVGCDIVDDALRLDLSLVVKGLGEKTREELLTKLERAGFPHPMRDEQPVSEIRILERSLERMRRRIDEALGAVAKEIRLVKQRLRKNMARREVKKASPAVSDLTPAPANDYPSDTD
ncbi:MAG: hypothetical protein LAP39_20535 [Acidobacteriia bacterium]|nr:hypothetical protein [Terriglobia bacterium]